jgi:hypothetical protein
MMIRRVMRKAYRGNKRQFFRLWNKRAVLTSGYYFKLRKNTVISTGETDVSTSFIPLPLLHEIVAFVPQEL